MSSTKTLSKTSKVEELGTFKIVSGKVRISDPCYDKKAWCAGSIKNVLNGTWKAQVIKKEEKYVYINPEDWAKGKTFEYNNNVLIAVHESFDKTKHTNKRKVTEFHGGMDAGMAGIFDDKFYKKNYKEDYLQVGGVEYDHNNWTFHKQRDIILYESQVLLAKTDPKKKQFLSVYKDMLKDAKRYVKNPPPPDYSKAEPTRDWYEICCDKSLSNIGAGVIRNGVVSSSGYGDGGFNTYIITDDNGKVVGIKLVF